MSPAKKKKKSRSASKPREPRPPKGMYLQVEITDNRALNHSRVITGFPDIVSIGHDVARAVREFIRSAPMLPFVRAYTVTVWPRWHGQAKPPRSAPETEAERLERLPGEEA